MLKWVVEFYRYLKLHLKFSDSFIKSTIGKPVLSDVRIIVSLTTIPSRIRKIFPTINSILHQTVRAHHIHLAIPYFSIREQKAYQIPKYLYTHPGITILPTDKDWGPATKFIPAIRREQHRPETIIIAIDDDNIYPYMFIETFIRYSRLFPEAALSLRGWHMPVSLRWKDSREFKGTEITTPCRTEVITGCGGILLKPGFFDSELFNYDPAPPQAFYVDDIWVSGHLAKRKIPRYVIPIKELYVYLPSIAALFGPALDRHENQKSTNNDVMIDYFRPHWKFH